MKRKYFDEIPNGDEYEERHQRPLAVQQISEHKTTH